MLKLATKLAPRPPALELAYRAGFRYAELWLDASGLAGWQNILRHARHYPNGYALHFPNRLDLAPEVLEATVALYRHLACSCLVIHPPMFDKYHDVLLRLEPELRLAVENPKLTPQGFLDWAERHPGLALDVEHLWKFTLGDGPLDDLLAQVRTFVSQFGDKLRHVHLPGYWPGFEEQRPMYCSRAMVFPVLSLLAESQFEGLIVSEVNPQYQNFNDLHMDVLVFDTWRAGHHPIIQT